MSSDKYVMTLLVNPEDSVWPEDPCSVLECDALVQFSNSFTRCSHDPVAFAQLKEHAPVKDHLALGKKAIDGDDCWKSLPDGFFKTC
jgi:hypothetical protein